MTNRVLFDDWYNKWNDSPDQRTEIQNAVWNKVEDKTKPGNYLPVWCPPYLSKSAHRNLDHQINDWLFKYVWFSFIDVFLSSSPRAVDLNIVKDRLFLSFTAKRDADIQIKSSKIYPAIRKESKNKNKNTSFIKGQNFSYQDLNQYRIFLLEIGDRIIHNLEIKQDKFEKKLSWEHYRSTLFSALIESISDGDRNKYRVREHGIIQGFYVLFELLDKNDKSLGLSINHNSLSIFCGEKWITLAKQITKTNKTNIKSLASFYKYASKEDRLKFKRYLINLSNEEKERLTNQFSHFTLQHLYSTPLTFSRMLLEMASDVYYPWCNNASTLSGENHSTVKLSFPKENLNFEQGQVIKNTNYQAYSAFMKKEKEIMNKQQGIHNMITCPFEIDYYGLLIRGNVRLINRFIYENNRIKILNKQHEVDCDFWGNEKNKAKFISKMVSELIKAQLEKNQR